MRRRLFALVLIALTACTPAHHAPVVVPPRPTPAPAPTPKPAPAVDPAACTDDTPDATQFNLAVSWNPAKTRAWVDATPKVKDSVFCPKYNTNPLSQGTCPLRPEGHIQAADCSRKHGVPAWFMQVDNVVGVFVQIASDEHDPWHVHVPKGSTVKACLDKYLPAQAACSPALTVQ